MLCRPLPVAACIVLSNSTRPTSTPPSANAFLRNSTVTDRGTYAPYAVHMRMPHVRQPNVTYGTPNVRSAYFIRSIGVFAG